MTLGIVLIAKNQTIVIVSDKRITEGTTYASAHGDLVEKIHKVTEKSGLTISGDAGTAVAVVDPFLKAVEVEQTKRKPNEIPISEVAEIFRTVAVESYTKWYGDMSIAEWVENVKTNVIPLFAVLLAGFDMDEAGNISKPKIIELSSFRRFAPVNITTNFAAIGVPTIARYLLYRFNTEMQDEAGMAGLAAFCIQETSSQTGDVGDQFQIASFSQEKPFRFYSESELGMIRARCAEIKTEVQTALFPSKGKEQRES